MSESYHYRGPSIDNSLLSPSGRCSKRARDAAMRRETARLFPPGFWDKPEPTPEEQTRQKIAALRRTSQNLRELAGRGMSPRKFTREADRLDAEAESIANAKHHSSECIEAERR